MGISAANRVLVITMSAVVAHALVCLPAIVQAAGEFEQGLRAARSGDLARAIEMWTVVIDRNPKSYAAYVNRGSAYLRSGHVFKGISDWHKARSLSPVFAYGVYTGDLVLQASGNTAMLNYAASLELDPEHVASVIMVGALYMDLEIGRAHV